ncbi:MAG: hypothetical protein JWN44_5648 [Myxococcales bacterium]|nr:hypothetical protein [Myxococcales bacterium]
MPAPLSRAHRRFLLVDEVIGSSIVNFLLNGAMAWWVFRKATSVPLWGSSSIAVDTLVTSFVLPLLTALIATPIVRAQVAWRKLPLLPKAELRSSVWTRRTVVMRGALLGVAAVVLVGAPVVLFFSLVGPHQLPTTSFILFKAGFAAALGAVVTPLLGWWALLDASR